jgi:hypothetical protein
MALDYSTVVANNPVPGMLQSLQAGANIGNMRHAQALAQQKAEADRIRQEQIDAAFALVHADPSATNYAALANILPPEMGKSVRESFEMLDKDKAKAALNESARVFAALKSGNPDVALRLLEEKKEAYQNANQTDKAKEVQTFIDIFKAGPDGPRLIEDMFGFTISMMPGGTVALDGITKYAGETRTEQAHPILMDQKRQELAKATSDAEIRAIESKYAEKVKIADLEQMGKTLGLTAAQINETIANTKYLDAKAAEIWMKIRAMQESPGGMDPDKRFDAEVKLNKEYDLRIQEHTEARRLNEVIATAAADGSGAGDVSLVFSFMKMLDPRSVVRESEFAQAQDTTGLIGKLQVAGQKVQSGQLLTPQQRADFKRLADEYMAASNEHEKRTRKNLEFLVKNYGLNPENVFGTKGTPSPSKEDPLAALRSFIKSKWPGEAAKIDGLDEAGLRKEYPRTIAQYKPTAATVEVDF